MRFVDGDAVGRWESFWVRLLWDSVKWSAAVRFHKRWLLVHKSAW